MALDPRIALAIQAPQVDVSGLVSGINRNREFAARQQQLQIENQRRAELDRQATAQQQLQNRRNVDIDERAASQEKRLTAQDARLTKQEGRKAKSDELKLASDQRKFAANTVNDTLAAASSFAKAKNYQGVEELFNASVDTLTNLGIPNEEIAQFQQAAKTANETGDSSQLDDLITSSINDINKSNTADFAYETFVVTGDDGKQKIVTQKNNKRTGKTEIVTQDLGGRKLGNLSVDEKIQLNKQKEQDKADIEVVKTAKKEAVKLAPKMKNQITNLTKSISNFDRAIDAIDQGAETGVVEGYFKTITDETLKLEQLANEMTIDVIGAVTFGALSEEELKLAQRTALPTGMSEEGLKQWLRDKKAATEKLRDWIEQEAIAYGSGEFTIGELVKRNKDRREGVATGQNNNSGVQLGYDTNLEGDDLIYGILSSVQQ